MGQILLAPSNISSRIEYVKDKLSITYTLYPFKKGGGVEIWVKI